MPYLLSAPKDIRGIRCSILMRGREVGERRIGPSCIVGKSEDVREAHIIDIYAKIVMAKHFPPADDIVARTDPRESGTARRCRRIFNAERDDSADNGRVHFYSVDTNGDPIGEIIRFR